MEKILVKSCVVKKQTEKWTAYEVITADGRKMEGFKELVPEKEYEVEIESGQYGLKYKFPNNNNKGGSGRNYTPNHRLEAMKLATQLSCYNIIKLDSIFVMADKIEAHLKQN